MACVDLRHSCCNLVITKVSRHLPKRKSNTMTMLRSSDLRQAQVLTSEGCVTGSTIPSNVPIPSPITTVELTAVCGNKVSSQCRKMSPQAWRKATWNNLCLIRLYCLSMFSVRTYNEMWNASHKNWEYNYDQTERGRLADGREILQAVRWHPASAITLAVSYFPGRNLTLFLLKLGRVPRKSAHNRLEWIGRALRRTVRQAERFGRTLGWIPKIYDGIL